LIDKSSFCSGNSTKATSCVAMASQTELFFSDMIKGGAKWPELLKVLCENSVPDVEWSLAVFLSVFQHATLSLNMVARSGQNL